MMNPLLPLKERNPSQNASKNFDILTNDLVPPHPWHRLSHHWTWTAESHVLVNVLNSTGDSAPTMVFGKLASPDNQAAYRQESPRRPPWPSHNRGANNGSSMRLLDFLSIDEVNTCNLAKNDLNTAEHHPLA